MSRYRWNTVDKLLSVLNVLVPGYAPNTLHNGIRWISQSPRKLPLSDDGPLYEPSRSCEERLSDAFAVIYTHSSSCGDSVGVCLRGIPALTKSISLYVALPRAATSDFEGWSQLLVQIVEKLYKKYSSRPPAIGDESVDPELVEAIYRRAYTTSRPLIIERGQHALSLIDGALDDRALSARHRRMRELLIAGLQGLVDTVKQTLPGDGGKDQFEKIFRHSIILATYVHDEHFADFVDKVDTYAVTRVLMYDLKSLIALSLAVKDLDAVIRDLVEVQSLCPITSWDVTLLGGPGAISVCPPSPTPEEVQGWFAELLQVPATSNAWCEVLADASEVAERARSQFAARDAHHGEAVLLQHIAENNIWVYPYIATSTDTMCFACYKLLLAVNAQRSMRLWTSSCSDESHLPRHLPALPEDVETCLVEDLMNDLRLLAETHQEDLAYCKKLISEGILDD